MATYFNGCSSSNTSEIQSSSAVEGTLPTLHLMKLTYVPYPDAPHHTTPNMYLFNNSHALNLANLSHAPPLSAPSHNQQPQHHLLHGVTNILGSTDSKDHHDTTAAAAPRLGYNLWGHVIDPPSSTAASNTGGYRRTSQQGLSLSLSSGEVVGIGNSPSSAPSNGVPDVSEVILRSKYLKATQELLDEVVNVGNGIYKEELGTNNKEKMKGNKKSTIPGVVGDGSNGGDTVQGAELNAAQRQELQMKKSKLVNVLDEVEQRYRQYHHQMQIMISSFEQAAGFGTAKSYTALALKTISKQFRCLKDAISSRIKATSKALGEDDCLGVKVEGSRLRCVDHHLRQQRALQQLGMIQPNAWRPQRGLPERAVSILRSWLFEHFLHPYPKDFDKVMLAKQTGLARSQVSNWFINARVRLWKPMVEEIYLEEIKEQQEQPNGTSDNNRPKESSKELGSTSNVTPGENKVLQQSKQESFNDDRTISPTEISTNSSVSPSFQSHSAFHLVGSSDKPTSLEMQNSPSSILSVLAMETKHRDTNKEAIVVNAKFGFDQMHHKDGYPLMSDNGNNGFGTFSMDDIGSRFNVSEQMGSRFHGNGVSLTLGLPHNENLPMSGTQHGFLSQNIHLGRRLEMETDGIGNEFCAINATQSSHSGTGYESNIDIQNGKRFATRLLHDFVA